MSKESPIELLLNGGICERGNQAFSYPESGKAVMFAKVSESQYFESSYTPENYPAWNCRLLDLSEEELIHHIQNRLGGWRVDKCQFDEIKMDREGNVLDLSEEVEE